MVKVNRPEENGAETSEPQSAENGESNATSDKSKVPKDIFDFYEKMDREEDDETELQTVSFEISQDSLEKLQKRFVTILISLNSILLRLTTNVELFTETITYQVQLN